MVNWSQIESQWVKFDKITDNSHFIDSCDGNDGTDSWCLDYTNNTYEDMSNTHTISRD